MITRFSPRTRWLITLVTILAVGATTRGVVVRDNIKNSQLVALAKATQFKPVGMIQIDYGFGYEPIASATLITPDLIMSAGHVFDRNALFGAKRVRFVLGGQNLLIDFKTPGVVHVHPGYKAGTLVNDISVAKLHSSSSVKPAALYGGTKEKGLEGTIVGFGDTGNGTTGSVFTNTRKLAGTNTIDYVSKTLLETDFDMPNNPSKSTFGKTTPITYESTLGPGDSGGGLWTQVNGQWVVVGVNSFGEQSRGSSTEDTYGWLSGYTRVSAYISFIKQYGSPTVVGRASASVVGMAKPDPERDSTARSPRARLLRVPVHKVTVPAGSIPAKG
jgi:hypothetical protein